MSYFSIFFVYLYYPMKFERKFLKGPPSPAEKKLDPLPWAFGARPRMLLIKFGKLNITQVAKLQMLKCAQNK